MKIIKAKVINPEDDGSIKLFIQGIIAIDDNGKIVFCGDIKDFFLDTSKFEIFDYSEHFVVPGMIDAHIHFPQFDAIGIGNGELLPWLENYIFPLEMHFNNFDFAYQKAELFFKELISNGTTTAFVYSSIHFDSTSAAFEAASKSGIKAFIGNAAGDINNPYKLFYSTDENLLISHKLFSKYHNTSSGKIKYIVTPRYAGNCSFELLQQLAKFANDNNLYVQTHLAENTDELNFVSEKFPYLPNYTEIYNQAGLISDKSIFAHSIFLSESEVKTLIEKDAIIAHCPNSNRFLISGLMPLINYLKLGANVAIGTDVAGGFYLSMFKEAREAIESSKTYKIFYDRSCNILDVRKAFRLTNIDAAKSLKIDKEIGNFKIGADADLLVINNPYVNGIYDLDTILSKLIYTCEPNHILATYIRGENYSANKVSKY